VAAGMSAFLHYAFAILSIGFHSMHARSDWHGLMFQGKFKLAFAFAETYKIDNIAKIHENSAGRG
jgi:hypothetical protein